MDTVGLGIIGLGVGRSRAQMAFAEERTRLVAVADLHEERRLEVSENLETVAYDDHRRLLERDDINVIGIFTPGGTHLDLAKDALAAGKHVISTKPMEVNIDRCDAMINAAEKAGKRLVVDFEFRYRPHNRAIKQMIDSGKFGRLLMGDVTLKWFRSQDYYEWDTGWRGTWSLDGGGALANQTIHLIDKLLWLMGPASSVFAQTATFNHDIEAEDAAAAVLTFENGALGTIVGTTTAPNNEFDFWRTEIHGDRGGAITVMLSGAYDWRAGSDEYIEQAILTDAAGGTLAEEIEPVPGPKNIMEDIAGVFIDGNDAQVTGAEGRKSIELLNAIYKSAHSGAQVSLPLDSAFKP